MYSIFPLNRHHQLQGTTRMIRSTAAKETIGTIILALFVLAFPSTGHTLCQVALQWDASSPSPDGYRLFAREKEHSYNYGNPHWEGQETTGTIDGLEEGKTYYTVARSYVGGDESRDSNEVRYTLTETCKVINMNAPWILFVPAIGSKSDGGGTP